MKVENFFTGQQLDVYLMAQSGQVDKITKTVKDGFKDIDTPGINKLSLLSFAAVKADRKAIISLIKSGANPNHIIPEVGSPAALTISQHFNPPDTKAIEALLSAGYDVNQRLSDGFPFLFVFADYDHWAGLNLALANGGNVNSTTPGGISLLAYIIRRGDYKKAHELIDIGADVSIRGQRDETPLAFIEFKIKKSDPAYKDVWKEMLELRELIISKLSDPKDKKTIFTDEIEIKIRQNPVQ